MAFSAFLVCLGIAVLSAFDVLIGMELDPTREPFPFTAFSLAPAPGNAAASLSFPITAFNTSVNVSITVDEHAMMADDSRTSLLVNASICEGRSGKALINVSTHHTSKYASAVVLPRSLFPDDLNCHYNASQPQLFVEVQGQQLVRGVDGTVAVRMADDALNETNHTTPLGHHLHFKEEVALDSNDSSIYPLPLIPNLRIGDTSFGSEIEVGVRRGHVEIWLASSDPACLGVFKNSEKLLEGSEGHLAMLQLMGEAVKGERLEVKINGSLIESFQQSEMAECVERKGQTTPSAPSDKSKETKEKVELVLGATSEPDEWSTDRHHFPPALVVIGRSPSTSIYTIYATIQHPAYDDRHVPPGSGYSWAVIIPIILTLLFVMIVITVVGVLFWREKRRQRLMRYRVQKEVIILRGFRNNPLEPCAGGINEAFEQHSINDAANGVSSTASTATIAETSFGGGPISGEMQGVAIDGHDNDNVASASSAKNKKGGGRFVISRFANANKGPDLNAWKL